MKGNSKFDLQDILYQFPYHYLPSLCEGNIPRIHRYLNWGLEYLTYMSFLADLIIQIAPQSLLDIGCGDGRLINLIKSVVPKTLGIDRSEQAISFARAFNPDIEFKCADIASLSGSYSLVTLIEVLEHIPDEDMENFIRNVDRLIQKNGFLLVSVPTVNVSLNKKHYRHYNLELLRSTLEPHFEIKKHWWLYRRGLLERWLRAMIVNRLFILNYSPLLNLIWRVHRRKTYFADASTGTHLVCLAKPVKQKRI